jgi:hypothetical protein
MATDTTDAVRAVKLTPAQIEMLREIAVAPRHCPDNYQPTQKLVALGLAVRKEHRLSSPSFTITPAGRAHPALAIVTDAPAKEPTP